MKFWDASAVVPLLVPETRSAECAHELADDEGVIVWALTPVETLSSIYRKHRDQRLADAALGQAQRRLESLRSAWNEVRDVELVGPRAERLLAVHALRAADALQLAAALISCDEKPGTLPFVCLDTNLAEAARREGFRILP